MCGSVFIGGISGFVFSIIMLFCIKDYESALASDNAYVQVFIDLFNSPTAGCLFICIVGVPINLFAAASITASSSRLAWAMACDGALPGGKYFSKLSPKSHIPARAVVLSTVCQGLLGAIYFGNDMAFYAILSIAVIGLNLSYGMPIYCIFFQGRQILDTMEMQGSVPGPGVNRRWNLGKWGWPINIVAGVWPAFISILFLFPIYLPESGPVSPEEANWSVAVLGGALIIATVYWFAYGKRQFVGPVTAH